MSKNAAKHVLWKRGCLVWKLHEGQEFIYQKVNSLPQNTREALLLCSRRWGKSYLGIIMALERCLQNDNIEVCICGPNLKQTKAIITPLINKIIEDAPEGLIKQQKSELLWKVGKSTLVIAAFDTATESCRGRDFDNIYLEESGLAPIEGYDYILNSVLRPTLMHRRGRIVHLTTLPKPLNHPLITTTLPKCVSSESFYSFTIEDNPLLTKEQIEKEIESMGGRDNPNCQRELFNRLVKDESSLVIPEFDLNRHVTKLTLPSHYYALSTLDLGGSMDKSGILVCYYDFQRAKFCVYREDLLDKNTSTSEITEATLELEKNIRWIQDYPYRLCDAPGLVRIDLSAQGFVCIQPAKEPGSVEANINALRLAFHRDEIEIDESCVKTISTLQFGSWTTNKKDWQRTPELGHLDLLAALLYGYRYANKNNPFPLHSLGISHATHAIPQELQQSTTERALKQAFTRRY